MSHPKTSQVSLSLRMMKALSLARVGKLREAELMLSPEGAVPQEPLAIQSLACLVTAEGDYSRGLRLWRLLLERDPGNAEALRMIEAIELWQQRPSWYRYLPTLGILTLILAAVGVGLALMPDSKQRARAAKPVVYQGNNYSGAVATPYTGSLDSTPTEDNSPIVILPEGQQQKPASKPRR